MNDNVEVIVDTLKMFDRVKQVFPTCDVRGCKLAGKYALRGIDKDFTELSYRLCHSHCLEIKERLGRYK